MRYKEFENNIDIDKILSEIESLPKWNSQIALQETSEGRGHIHGTGSWFDLGCGEDEFTEFIFNLPYTNQVCKDLGLYRARLMNIKPKECYSYHKDLTIRLHVPLITNRKAMLILDGKVVNFPANGNHFLVDTTRRHTALNAHKTIDRIHLIGCTKANFGDEIDPDTHEYYNPWDK